MKVGRISIDLTAGTAAFIADMEAANAKLRDFSVTASTSQSRLRGFGDAAAHSVTGVQATSAALRLLEGNITNNLRAGERFLANTLGLGRVLQTAFPIVGGLALLGVVTELVKRVGELYDKFKALQDAPSKIAEDFRRVSTSIALSNDELRLENDKLETAIAKLEGKPHNALAEALDEARVAADKLSESLQKDFTDLNKLLKEDQVSWFDRLLGGRAGSSDITDQVKKLGHEIQEVQFEAREKVRNIQPGPNAAAEAESINKAADTRVQSIRSRGIDVLKKELTEAENSQTQFLQPLTPTSQVFGAIGNSLAGGGLQPGGLGPATSNQDQRIPILRETIRALEEQSDSGPLGGKNAADKAKQAGLQAKADADALTRPYQDKLNELAAQLSGFKTQLASIGKGEVGITLANSWAEAQKAIAKLNDDLAKHNQALTIDQVTTIHAAYDSAAIAKAEVEWKTKLDQTTTSIQERIQSLKLLTAAIGEGYEAQKKASVETQLIEKFGKQYNDEQFLSQKVSVTGQTRREQVNRERTLLTTEYDVNQQKTVSESLDKISTQIELEESLARAESQGAEAVRQATLQHQLSEIAKNNSAEAAKKLSQAETNLANAQQKVKAETTLAQLQQEIEATNRLTAAQVGGAEAVRQAQLQNRIAEIQRNVPQQFQSEEIRKVTEQSESQHNLEVTSNSLKTGLSYQNRLSELSQEITYLKSIKGTKDETLATDISLKELEKEQVQILSEQAQVLGSARDGLRVFFQEMAEQGVSAAKEVHDALKQTFDSLNDQLAKLISGEKTNWASFFKGISADLAKVSLRNLEATIATRFAGPAGQGGVGSTPGAAPGAPSGPHGILQTLGAAIFGKPGAAATGKRDGNSPATALFVTTVDAQSAANPAPSVSASPASTPGVKPEIATTAPDLSAANRLPEHTLGEIPNLVNNSGSPSNEISASNAISASTESHSTSAPNALLSLPQAIAKFEGFGASPGNLPTKNNNPGDIKFGPFAHNLGATKDQHSPFAVFSSPEAGQSAITKLLQTPGYQKLTIKEAIERWNGKDQPNNAQYVAAISKMTGLSPDSPLSQAIPQQPNTSLGNTYTNAYSDTNVSSSELSQLEFGGFRADGGDVDSDQAHVVGEDGPELFIPGADGTIVSNDKLKQFFDNTQSNTKVTELSKPAPTQSWLSIISQALGGGKISHAFHQGSSANSVSSLNANTNTSSNTTTLGSDGLPIQGLPDIQMGDVQGALPPSLLQSLGGVAGLATTGIGIGLGFLARFLSRHHDFHFHPGNPYAIPNWNGAYADGGKVDAGKTHLVGEKGPELFVPKSDGSIIPNHKLGEFKSSSVLTEAVNGGGTHSSTMRFSELETSSFGKSFSKVAGISFGGYRASGGSVDPSFSYMVGEQGPEMWTPPGSGGTIIPNDKLSGNGPGQTIYVDARNSDPAATEQRIRQGMQAANNSAVRTAFKSWQEYQKRTPMRS